jgi:hypothetical protein
MQVSDLDSAANRQACEWLGEVAQRLNVVIEVIDAHHVLLCPVGSTLDAANVRGTLTNGDSSVHSTMDDAMQSKMPLPLMIDDMQALCFGLAPGGVLLLARHAEHDESFEECRNDLESVGAWLTAAIESSLGQPNAVAVEPYRILSFRRILRDATTRGSFRRVIGAFVEAMSVWDDVRVSAYVPAAADGFFQYVPTMAVRPASAPDHLDQSVLPRLGRITRLARGEADRLGLAPDPGDTLLFRFGIGTETEWALVFSGMIDDRVEVRLRVYSDILREALSDVLTMAISRIAADVGRRPTPSEPLENAVKTALGQLVTAVGGREAAMSLATTVGRQLLAVGKADLLSGLDQLRPNRLVVRVSDGSGVMTVAIERDQIPFAAFEREIIEAGAAAMLPWVQTSLQRSRDAERRHSFRPIDTVFDQLATEAVAAGQQASVIVMFVDAAALHPGLLPAWVGRIRGQLRGGDRAGMLSDHEIAVLLCGASADQAATVSARLQQLLESDASNGVVHPNIGMTTRVPDTPFEGSLVGAARASASCARNN